jgi:hypothetical protein
VLFRLGAKIDRAAIVEEEARAAGWTGATIPGLGIARRPEAENAT